MGVLSTRRIAATLFHQVAKKLLEDLPSTLDETYERVLREINEASREHALCLLQCLAVAHRPLRVEELAEALRLTSMGRTTEAFHS